VKVCPLCASSYGDEEGTCARDGQPLVEASALTSAGASSPTATTIRAAGSPPGATTAAAAALATAPAASAAPDEAFDSLVGATLAGRYLIVRRIGEGGMGAVYEAKHTIIGKRVAVKVLLEKFLAKSDFVARLLQEARLASAIGHEHIVDVTDFGTTDDGRAFVVMEFLEGEALSQLVMREAPLPVERALRLARQVASALAAAHAKGIVHRDVKPENVYLIRRGDADFVKVVDFGISKAVKQGQGEDAPDYRLTNTGLLLGTPLYMSPEQARGEEDLDQRVDVWALGVMLYECLTGEVPFRANNYLGIISQVLTHEAIPPSRLRPELGISVAVETVVMRAMEKDRSRRYPTMVDVEADLDRLLGGDQNVGAGATPIATTTPPPSKPDRGRAWVWGAAVAALIGGVAMALSRPEPRSAAAPAAPAASSVAAPAREVRRAVAPLAPLRAEPSTRPPAATSPPDEPGPAATAADARAGRTAALGRTGNHPTRDKVDRAVSTSSRSRAAASTTTESPATRHTSQEVLRGALPSRSGEGYPDLP